MRSPKRNLGCCLSIKSDFAGLDYISLAQNLKQIDNVKAWLKSDSFGHFNGKLKVAQVGKVAKFGHTGFWVIELTPAHVTT